MEIFFISVLILFLELALIRWIGTEIRIFAFLGNLTLIMCFFGVGWGCYRAAKPVDPVVMAVSLLFLVALVANPFHIAGLSIANVTFRLSGFEDSTVWQDIHAPARLYHGHLHHRTAHWAADAHVHANGADSRSGDATRSSYHPSLLGEYRREPRGSLAL